jgi:twinkle protein
MASNVRQLLIQDTPIDWDRYVLDDADLERFVDPASLVGRISDVLHQRGVREGVPLLWQSLADRVRIRRGKLAIWAGINHHGKTVLVKQLSLQLTQAGEKVCIASLEETPEETMADVTRMAIPQHDVMESDDWIDLVCSRLSGKLWLYNQRMMMTPQRILALIAYAARERGCTHFILDSLMRTGIEQDDGEGQRVFLNQLTHYASTLSIGIHVVHHIVKADESEVPKRHTIRGGGAMLDQADQIFIAWRDIRENKGLDDPDGMLIVAKNRGMRPLNWLGKIQLNMHPSGQFIRQKHDRPIDYIGLPTTGNLL